MANQFTAPFIVDPTLQPDYWYGFSARVADSLYRALECERCGAWANPALSVKPCACGHEIWVAVHYNEDKES